MLSKQQLSSKIAIFGLLILLVFLGNLKYKQWKNQLEIEKQKQNLQSEADALEKKNNELNQSLQYLNSPSFKERVAREQLNLKKDGETVYSFGDAATSSGLSLQTDGKTHNAQKWWNYFFAVQ